MKNMNPKLVKLLHEGISIVTLEKLNDEQLNVLFERVSNKKETKEMVNVKVGSPQEKELKAKGETYNTYEGEVTEKSVSKQQQKIMGLALSVKRGDTKKSEVSKKVKDIAKKMSEKDLEDFAGTKHKGLPKKKKDTKEEEVKKLEESIMRLVENHLYPQVKKSDLIGIINKGKK
jgi:hypothetical protein